MADSTISAKARSEATLFDRANSDPSMAATVQSALDNTTVGEFNGDTPSLADHLRAIGVDPASVVA